MTYQAVTTGQWFAEGAKVVSPYASDPYYAQSGIRPMSHTIGTVGPVDDQGWANVTYGPTSGNPDGYRVRLNAERCIPVVVEVPERKFQSIIGITDNFHVRYYLSELVANLTIAANQADRDKMHGTAERLRNDIKALEECGKGTLIELV
jgi:hypothetical protein